MVEAVTINRRLNRGTAFGVENASLSLTREYSPITLLTSLNVMFL